MEGSVVAVSWNAVKGVAKVNRARVRLVENWGVEGDAHAGVWHRQVSLLAMESIEKMRARGAVVGPGAFAENITTRGVALHHLKPGARIRIGETELEVTQIGKVCHARCAIFERVGDCVMPREGIFVRVLKGGEIRPGDTVRVTAEASACGREQRDHAMWEVG